MLTHPGVYFGAGPALLPREVLSRFSSQTLVGHQCELRFYELSHRHPLSLARQREISECFRALFNIPEQYRLLFLAGGARHQYEQILLNFSHRYRFLMLESGHWARAWADTIEAFCPDRLTRVPVDVHQEMRTKMATGDDCEMLFTVLNETVDGHHLPISVKSHPCAVADATSQMGFRHIDVTDYQMLFMQTSKALGVAGMTIVICHEDLLAHCASDLMPLQSYQSISQHESLYSTPPLVCMDVLWHMLCWMDAQGGMSVLSARQYERASRLYKLLENQPGYRCRVPAACRSTQNICFDVPSGLSAFLDAAEKNGLYGLRGHAAVGGVRVNLYHGIDDDAYERLIGFLNAYGDRI